MIQARGREGRIPGTLNMAAGTVVLLLVLTLALRSAQSTTPAIAEFAPQAQKPIQNAPSEQTASVGNGAGGAAIAAPATPSPSGAASGLAAGAVLLDCVGDPPRQIEDPQSPPCIPYWQGNNGGATAPHVGASQINVGTHQTGTAINDMQAFFNKRFELYGRHINLVPETLNYGSCSGEQAASDQMAQQLDAFAILDPIDQETDRCLFEEDAHNGVLSIAAEPWFTEAALRQLAPWVWQYPAAADTEFADLGTWACHRLAGYPAAHGTGTTGNPPTPIATTKRKFGLVYEYSPSADVPSTAPLVSALRECGETVDEVDWVWNSNTDYATPASSTALRLRQDGDTTIFVVAANWERLSLSQAADNENYHPEWVIDSRDVNDNDGEKSFWSQGQTQGFFGLTHTPKQVPIPDDPVFWAIKGADPGYNTATGAPTDPENFAWEYRTLLLLASGIQMAGPKLTPRTFQHGLFAAAFPNPQTSIYAGSVDFPGGHSMTQDTAEMFFSQSTADPYGGGPGTWCYVDKGMRRMANQYPRGGDPYYNQPCDP